MGDLEMTEMYGYGKDYGTDTRTSSSNIYTKYTGTGDDWLSDSYKNYKIYNNLIETTTMNSIWKEYTNSTTTISQNYFKGYDAAGGAVYDIRWETADAWTAPVVAPSERMRQMIQARMAPAFHRSRTSLSIAMDVREERARQTLRRIIGDQAFKKFMRDGFITVVPKSGLTYRIYPGSGMTEVYDRGIMVDRLCVVLQGEFPPTDSILMRYLLILNDEGEFSRYAIKHYVSQSRSTKLVFPTQEEAKPLTEAWAALKLKVA